MVRAKGLSICRKRRKNGGAPALCTRASSSAGSTISDRKAAVCCPLRLCPSPSAGGFMLCGRQAARFGAGRAAAAPPCAWGPGCPPALFHPTKPTRGFHKGEKGLLPAKPHNEAVKLASPALRPVTGLLTAPADAFPFPGASLRQPALPRAEAEAFRGPPSQAQQAACEMNKGAPGKARGRRISFFCRALRFPPQLCSAPLCAHQGGGRHGQADGRAQKLQLHHVFAQRLHHAAILVIRHNHIRLAAARRGDGKRPHVAQK